MNADTWTNAEKRVASELFERAAANEEAQLIDDLKSRAAKLTDLDSVLEFQAHFGSVVREFQGKYDFRYSQLLFVFARFVREGRLHRGDFYRLSDDKLADGSVVDMHSERNVAVLAVSIAVLASAIIHPIDWRVFVGLVLAGWLLTLGGNLAERSYWGLGTTLVCSSLLLAAIVFVHGLPGSKAWWWVQGGGIYFVSAMLPSMVVSRLKSARVPTKP